MKNEAMIEGVIVAGQPSDDEICELSERGITTLINVRLRQELRDPEGPKAAAAGLEYVEVPFNGDTITFADVHRVREALERAPESSAIHCHGGTRAAVVAAIVAAERGGEGHQGALRRIGAAGFDVEGTAYHAFIERYFARSRP